MHQQETAFENNVGNEEIVRNEQFLLFPQSFLLNQLIVPVSPFVHTFDIISLFTAELEESKIGISGKGLTNQCSKYQWKKEKHEITKYLSVPDITKYLSFLNIFQTQIELFSIHFTRMLLTLNHYNHF